MSVLSPISRAHRKDDAVSPWSWLSSRLLLSFHHAILKMWLILTGIDRLSGQQVHCRQGEGWRAKVSQKSQMAGFHPQSFWSKRYGMEPGLLMLLVWVPPLETHCTLGSKYGSRRAFTLLFFTLINRVHYTLKGQTEKSFLLICGHSFLDFSHSENAPRVNWTLLCHFIATI